MLYVGIGVALTALVLFVWLTYNNLVQLRNKVKEAFSTMDVYLKKRYDLIPNLVDIVKGYAKHETDTLQEVTKMRVNAQKGDLNTAIDSEMKIGDALHSLLVVVLTWASTTMKLRTWMLKATRCSICGMARSSVLMAVLVCRLCSV